MIYLGMSLAGLAAGGFALFYGAIYGGDWLYQHASYRGKAILANGFALALVMVFVAPPLVRWAFA